MKTRKFAAVSVLLGVLIAGSVLADHDRTIRPTPFQEFVAGDVIDVAMCIEDRLGNKSLGRYVVLDQLRVKARVHHETIALTLQVGHIGILTK